MKKKQLRTAYLIAFLVLLCVEVIIGIYVRDTFVRPYIGDVLVVILICCLLRIIRPTGIKLLPLFVFVFALFVELLQLLNIVDLLGIPKGSFIAIIIGNTFSLPDIICYGVGCTLIFIIEQIIKKHP